MTKKSLEFKKFLNEKLTEKIKFRDMNLMLLVVFNANFLHNFTLYLSQNS